MSDPREAEVARLLMREAELLDERRWDEWLELMAPDVEYWIPAWHSESELTNDPGNELSLIYYDSRIGLEDRVFRLKSKQSLVSTPMPRTCHFVSNIRTEFLVDGNCRTKANWQVHSYRQEQANMFFGFYQYLLAPRGDGHWRIQKKKIVVMNELIPTVLDVHLV